MMGLHSPRLYRLLRYSGVALATLTLAAASCGSEPGPQEQPAPAPEPSPSVSTAPTPEPAELDPMNEQAAVRIPTGLADPAADVAYVVDPEGLIECLDLETGEVLARSEFSGTPLAIDRGALIGWAPAADRPNAVQLFAAVRQNGVLVRRWQQVVELPDWVEVASTEPDRFTLEASIDGAEIVAEWQAQARYEGGAPAPDEVEEAATRDGRRSVRLDRDTGQALGVEEIELAPTEQEALPDLSANQYMVPYRSEASWLTRPWRAGKTEAFLVRTLETPGVMLVRQGGPEAGEVRISEDPGAIVAVTPEGSLVFVHEPGKGGDTWHVFATETGERVARLPFDPGTEGVSVVNDRVVYLVVERLGATRRRSLRCRNLHSGEAIWSRALGDETLEMAPPPPP